MGLLRFLVGLALVPACVVVTRTALSLLVAAQPESLAVVPPSAWAVGGGYAVWMVVYFALPLPVRSYVLAHELTHALWAWLMGARVLNLRVEKEKGSVTLSQSNFLIALAPYFFPLYTVLVIAAYYIMSVFWDVERFELTWLALIGFSWGFHLTFTVRTLMQRQSDIQEYGRLFSYTVIYLVNLLGICLWFIVVSPVSVEAAVSYVNLYAVEMWHSMQALTGTVLVWVESGMGAL